MLDSMEGKSSCLSHEKKEPSHWDLRSGGRGLMLLYLSYVARQTK